MSGYHWTRSKAYIATVPLRLSLVLFHKTWPCHLLWQVRCYVGSYCVEIRADYLECHRCPQSSIETPWCHGLRTSANSAEEQRLERYKADHERSDASIWNMGLGMECRCFCGGSLFSIVVQSQGGPHLLGPIYKVQATRRPRSVSNSSDVFYRSLF